MIDIIESEHRGFLENLWETIDSEIKLKDCTIFTYLPSLDDVEINSPISEDGSPSCRHHISESIWNFLYFFVNSKNKRILTFACSAKSVYTSLPVDSEFDDFEYPLDYQIDSELTNNQTQSSHNQTINTRQHY